jgi:sarcosine oxidase subunit gamma
MRDLSAARTSAILESCALARPLPPLTRLALRGAPATLRAAAGALGLEAVAEPCRASWSISRALLWLGPDERLLLDEQRGESVRELLERALGSQPHSLVDVSHAMTALEISGPGAATALNLGCPLDFEPDRFPVGMCTRTLFAKAQIVLWRTGAESFRLEVARSFGPYVAKLLALAARESGPRPDQDFGRSLAGSYSAR